MSKRGQKMRVSSQTTRIRSSSGAKMAEVDHSRRYLLPLDERLGLDDGVFGREGVEGTRADAARDGLYDDDAQRRQTEAVASLAVEDQPLAGTVGRQFLVGVVELLRRQRL